MKKLLIASLMVFAAPLCFAATQAQIDNQLAAEFEPPTIPHEVATFLPITAQKNACLMCHKPGVAGQKVAKGTPTPLPASHVTDGKVNPNRYECMLCHVKDQPVAKK